MGTLMITTNQTLNLATYGLKVGDIISVICIGGGAGGNYGTYYFISGNNVKGGYGGAAGCPGLSGSNCSGGGGAGGGYGAGGGGGGAIYNTNSSYNGQGGNGGGAGAYNITTHMLNSTTVNSIAITIGAGGTGGSMTQNTNVTYKKFNYISPTNGGVTSFGSILSANGGIIDRGGPALNWGGGGGAGGYLFPQKIYGGTGGRGGVNLGQSNFSSGTGNMLPTGNRARTALQGAGGGGGAAGSNSCFELPQESLYGGCGGAFSKAGTYGVESHGSGLVVVMW